eukprot:3108277-Pyramimonas_sp.AAC.1
METQQAASARKRLIEGIRLLEAVPSIRGDASDFMKDLATQREKVKKQGEDCQLELTTVGQYDIEWLG